MTSSTATPKTIPCTVAGPEPDDTGSAKRIEETLLFMIQELGSLKRDQRTDQDVYVPGPTCDKAIKDIAKYCICSRS